MAAHAASLITAGAGKSGNPCDRLTPPWRSLSRVISRMTDSVNCVAFLDPVSFDMLLFRRCGGRLLFRRHGRRMAGGAYDCGGGGDVRNGRGAIAVQAPVVLRRAENFLYVPLRLGKRDVVDELVLRDA